MEKYLIPLVPGPVAVPQEILKVAATNFGSADFEPEYLALYKDTEKLLQKMMETRNRVVIQTGEGMLVLWTALKSTLKPGDRVLVLSTGLFGEGFGDMAIPLGVDGRHLLPHPHVNAETVPKTLRSLQRQFFLPFDHTTHIIRQAAVGVGHIAAALDHHDLRVFIQTADAGSGRRAAGHAAYNYDLHFTPSTMAVISALDR